MRRLLSIAFAATIVAVVAASAQCAAAAVPPKFDAAAIDAQGAHLRARLRAAITAVDASLALLPPETSDSWRSYLRWDAWAALALVTEAWDAQAMKRIAKRLYAAEQGFEVPLIVELRSALTDYLTFAEAVEDAGGDLEGEYYRRIDQLQRAGDDYAELEAAAWWLAATGQAPETLAQLRARFSGSVIVGQIHRDLIEAKLNDFENTSHEVRRTRHSIQGASVVGTAHVNSHATAALANGPDDARLRVISTGTILSPRNVSTSGNVRVFSSSRSQFTATADVFWNGARFVMTTPTAAADVHSTIRSIDSPWLGRRIAARRVHGSRASAEAQAEALIEREAVEAMSAKLAVAVEKLNRKSQGFLNLMARTGNSAQRWSTRVRENAVEIGYLPHTLTGMGSLPRETPPLASEEMIGLSFHDAALEALFRSQVAGAEWSDIQFATLQRELTGGNNEELFIGLHPGRWSAQWSWRLPVRIHFSPDGVQVRYRFARAVIDGVSRDTPFEVCADLRVVAKPLGLELLSRSPVSVVSLEPSRPLPPDFQSFLERKFDGLFGERFYLDGLQFPAGGHLDPLSGYRVVAAHLEPSWIHLRYTKGKSKVELVVSEKAD